MLGVQQVRLRFVPHWVLDLIAHDFNVFKQHHGLERAQFHSFHRVFDTEANHTCVQGNLLEEATDNFLFLDELHVGERVLGECDCLAEALIEAI